MPIGILKSLFAVMLMIGAGALPQRTPQTTVATTARADAAALTPAEASVSGAAPEAAQPASVNPVSLTKTVTSEPLLLLLMGALLIALGGSIRRFTKSRGGSH